MKKLLTVDKLQEPFLITDHEHIFFDGSVSSDLLDLMTKLEEVFREKKPSIKFESGQDILNLLKPNFLTVTYENWFIELRSHIENMIIELVLWMADYLIKIDKKKQSVQHLATCLILFDENEEIYDKLLSITTNGSGRY